MKKLSFYIFLLLLCFNFLNKANAIPKKGNGQGDLALSEDIIKEFHSYITTRTNNNPLNFFITADHKNVFIEIRKNTTYRGISGSGPIVRNKKKCEQKYKQECFLFANQRVVVWNNGINPNDSKKSKFKRKTSYDELVIKLNEWGFIEIKEQKVAKEKKLAEAKGTKKVTWQVFVKLTGEMGNNSNLPGFNAKETLKIKSIKDQINIVKKVIDKALSKCENSNVKWTISLRGNKICTVTVVKYFDEENLNNNNKYVNLLGIKFDDLIITINGLENVTSEKIDERAVEEKKLADEKVVEEKKLADEKVVEEKKLADEKVVEEKLVRKLSLIPAETDLEKAQNFIKNIQEFIKFYPDEFDIVKLAEFFIIIKPIVDGDLNYKSKKDLEQFKEFTNTSDLFVKYNNDIEKGQRDKNLNKINDAILSLENNIKIIKGFLVMDQNSIYLEEWLSSVKNALLVIDNPSSYDQLLTTNDDLIKLIKQK